MSVEFKGLTPSSALEERVTQKLDKLEHRLGEKISFKVKLDKETNTLHNCAIRCSAAGQDFNATSSDADLIKAADEAMSKLEKQINKTLDRHDRKGQDSIRTAPPKMIEPEVSDD